MAGVAELAPEENTGGRSTGHQDDSMIQNSLYRQGRPVEDDIVPLWPAISGALDAYRSSLSRFRVDLIQVEIN
jgi:hypothetical protein